MSSTSTARQEIEQKARGLKIEDIKEASREHSKDFPTLPMRLAASPDRITDKLWPCVGLLEDLHTHALEIAQTQRTDPEKAGTALAELKQFAPGKPLQLSEPSAEYLGSIGFSDFAASPTITVHRAMTQLKRITEGTQQTALVDRTKITEALTQLESTYSSMDGLWNKDLEAVRSGMGEVISATQTALKGSDADLIHDATSISEVANRTFVATGEAIDNGQTNKLSPEAIIKDINSLAIRQDRVPAAVTEIVALAEQYVLSAVDTPFTEKRNHTPAVQEAHESLVLYGEALSTVSDQGRVLDLMDQIITARLDNDNYKNLPGFKEAVENAVLESVGQGAIRHGHKEQAFELNRVSFGSEIIQTIEETREEPVAAIVISNEKVLRGHLGDGKYEALLVNDPTVLILGDAIISCPTAQLKPSKLKEDTGLMGASYKAAVTNLGENLELGSNASIEDIKRLLSKKIKSPESNAPSISPPSATTAALAVVPVEPGQLTLADIPTTKTVAEALVLLSAGAERDQLVAKIEKANSLCPPGRYNLNAMQIGKFGLLADQIDEIHSRTPEAKAEDLRSYLQHPTVAKNLSHLDVTDKRRVQTVSLMLIRGENVGGVRAGRVIESIREVFFRMTEYAPDVIVNPDAGKDDFNGLLIDGAINALYSEKHGETCKAFKASLMGSLTRLTDEVRPCENALGVPFSDNQSRLQFLHSLNRFYETYGTLTPRQLSKGGDALKNLSADMDNYLAVNQPEFLALGPVETAKQIGPKQMASQEQETLLSRFEELAAPLYEEKAWAFVSNADRCSEAQINRGGLMKALDIAGKARDLGFLTPKQAGVIREYMEYIPTIAARVAEALVEK